jgi:membrane dipeptidase
MPDAADTYRDAIVIDGVSPLIKSGNHLDRYIKGGVTAVCPTVAVNENAAEALRNLGLWRRLARDRSDLLLVGKAADIRRAKREGKLGIIPHFQNVSPIEDSLDLVDAWAGAGVRMIQLSYNVRNLAGDGCEEPTDAGLSRFGRALVERLEAARVVVDCSHTGDRTTIEAVRMATRPIVVSHANARAVFQSARNLTDETIRAIADKGGLVGLVGYPGFVSSERRPTLHHLIPHLDHLVRVGGIDHVGLGLDYYEGQAAFSDDASAASLYEGLISSGAWSSAYPPPPWHYPEEIDTPDKLPNLAEALAQRGWAPEAISKVLGGNWLRVFEDVWGG